MKKAGLVLGLFLLLGLNYQCTEDEDIQANTSKVKAYQSESREEASDGLDTKKD